VASFVDEDFSASCKQQPKLTLAMGGEAYKERLVVALWARTDISIWVQEGNAESNGRFTMRHVADYHDAHDGEVLGYVALLQNALGIATAGEEDSHQIRLWSFSE